MSIEVSRQSHFDKRPDSPIVDWDDTRGWRMYGIDEVYDVKTKKGKWFPNVNDYIANYHLNVFERVTFADRTSLEYKTVIAGTITPDNSGAIEGCGGPNINKSYRVYIDDSKFPATLRVDSRLQWTGADNNSYRVFRGQNISDTGEVISANIKDGKLVGNTLPMLLAAIDNVDNLTIMSPAPGHAKGEFKNWEPCSIVVYGDNDTETSIAYAYIVKTNMHMSEEDSERIVLGVELVSPFLNPSNKYQLDLPINIPLDDIPLSVKVTYNSGVVEYPLDGTKCALDGLRNSGSFDTFYISSLTGQRIDLTLRYNLAKNETYVGTDLFGSTIIKDYTASTLPVDGAYSVKLYVVPQWLDVARGYKLNYYLYNLDRGSVYDATPHIELGADGAVFDPKLYGVKQTINIRCDLGKVSPNYNNHIHAQTYHITLLAQGNQNRDPYLIEYNPTESIYGEGLNIKFDYDNVKYWTADVKCGCKDKSEWLTRLYRNIHPLFDRRTEDEAPEPTHFEIVIGSKVYTRTINQWLETFNIDFQVKDGNAVYIKWLKRTPTGTLQLGLSPLIARQIG